MIASFCQHQTTPLSLCSLTSLRHYTVVSNFIVFSPQCSYVLCVLKHLCFVTTKSMLLVFSKMDTLWV
ncbi:hypothetical protein GBAR_LOCUS20787 [Geodia barretti]|uniref:Uncharacterized protein n=1 Tax=Geodia barretti TaxID=519541 RepID=A0AA35SX15_GEOBA|nr:hypothetical protein GBAR_LOCUS20787 [Geodia barretti]